MTKKNSSVAIAAEIETLRADLAKVTATVDLLGKPAIAKAEQISTALDAAKERLADILADEAMEARKKRLAGFSAIRVDWDREETNLLRASFTITYTRLRYDAKLRHNVPIEHQCVGFLPLDGDAFDYLISMRPEAIPTPIMALAPDNPHEAFSIFLAAKSRGYFKGRPAA